MLHPTEHSVYRYIGRFRPNWLALGIALSVMGCALQPLSAADIIAKEVGGIPVMRCKVRYGSQFIDTHIIFDISLDSPMVIHSRTIRGLGLHPMMARGKKVDLEFDANTRLKGIPIQITEDKLLETITRLHADELNQVPVTAMIGLKAFNENVIELDMPRGLLRTLRMASDEARSREIDCQILPAGVLLKGIGPLKIPVTALMSTKQMDSEMDISLLEKVRKAGKKRLALSVGDSDLGAHTAFRFPRSGLTDVPAGTDMILGLSAIRNHAVTIWPKRKKIAFIEKRTGRYPQAEQDYFYALVDKEYAGIRKFVDAHKRHRLLDEALIRLWRMRSADTSCPTQELRELLDVMAAKYDGIRRAMALSQISDSLETGSRTDRNELSMYALTLAIKQSGKALNHSTVHGVHLRLGKKAFSKGDLKAARRHLLSAAFGLPKDAECNFWLAEVYREMGKPRRAWSRYYQALVDVGAEGEMKAKALQRIELLNNDPAFRRTFTMLMAEQYTSGRSSAGEFHAPYRYKLEKHQFPGHVRLIECFVNSNQSYSAVQQMAVHALTEYFDGETAYIEYHLNDRMHSDVAATRLKYYTKSQKPSTVLDGKPTRIPYTPPRSDSLTKKVETYYTSVKSACLQKTPVNHSGWDLKGNLTREGQTLSGTVSITGEEPVDKVYLHAIVCERSVMAVEKNGVLFHRFVARTALTPPEGRAVSAVIKEPLVFDLDADALAKQNLSSKTYIDARLLLVVAFLQRQSDGHVLAVESFSLPQEDEIF